MFSSRLPAKLEANAVSRAIDRRRASGATLLDLTQTNPTAVGISYPADVLSSLSNQQAAVYAPDPLGLAEARSAVADEARATGIPVAASQIVLTASTSDAYALLFKLLCNPGDEVLVPQPSYPLFEMLTRLEGIEPVAVSPRAPWRLVDRSGQPRTRDDGPDARGPGRQSQQSDGIDDARRRR